MKRSCIAMVLLATACVPATAPSRTPCAPAASASAATPTMATCFVLREVDGPVIRQGDATCARRLSPASTFKVPHALIALEVGARTGPDDLERWDGTKHARAVDDRDHTLASAIRTSTVWYFQRTAVKIGRERMVDQLARIRYGNGIIADNLTGFWLSGPLAISADEQADFFERLARRSLPLKPEVVDAVDAMTLQSPGAIIRGGTAVPVDVSWDPATTRVYAKTGRGDVESDGSLENVHWLVGHVATPKRGYGFASVVVSRGDLDTEAIVNAMHGLRDAGVLQAR